jgi:hypothetical protein
MYITKVLKRWELYLIPPNTLGETTHIWTGPHQHRAFTMTEIQHTAGILWTSDQPDAQ